MGNKRILFYFFMMIFFGLIIIASPVYAKEVDVALFWGQSNMVGACGTYGVERRADTRKLNNIIDSDILNESQTMSYVKVPVPSGTAYEYNYSSNSLIEISPETRKVGEYLTYKNKKLYSYNTNTKSSLGYYSLQQSRGTNMIPKFCEEYYLNTGRTLVVVMAAQSGEAIGHFLPSTDSDYSDKSKQYIYEAMTTKYKAAIKCIKSKGYTIGNQFYVVCQGEADSNKTLADSYYKTFEKVHKYLRKDLNLDFGAIVETARKIREKNNASLRNGVETVHKAQVNLAKNHSDIIIATNFGYNAYKNNISACFCPKYNDVHYTSATLSQIGKRSAKSVYNYLRVEKSNQAPHITVSFNSNDSKVKYNVRDGNKISTFTIRQNSQSGKKLYSKKINSSRLTENLPTDILPTSGNTLKYWAKTGDAYGNNIATSFTIRKNSDNTYSINNAPNLIRIFSEKVNGEVMVYFILSDGTGIKSAYTRNLTSKTFTEKKLQKLKSNTSAKRAKIAVNLKEMTYKDGKYYIYLKAYDTTNLCSTQRIIFTLKK